jgi:hypothetical protein
VKICNTLHSIVRAAECVTNEMRENESSLDVCRVSNGAHIEMHVACKQFCEVQCLKLYLSLLFMSEDAESSILLP